MKHKRKPEPPKQKFIQFAGMEEKKVLKFIENSTKICSIQKNIKPG